VNIVTEGHQRLAKVVSFPAGGGVAVWQTRESSSAVHAKRISFRLFSEDGSPSADEVEILPPEGSVYFIGAWALGATRVGEDRFALFWHLVDQDLGTFQIFDKNGTPVTGELALPNPQHSIREVAREPHGFLLLMQEPNDSTGPTRVRYLYRFDTGGQLQAGPVDVEILGAYDMQVMLAGEDGTFKIFFASYGEFFARTFDTSTLLPVGDPVSVVTVTQHPHLLVDARLTPWGPVVAAFNGYDGVWLYWLDPDGNHTVTTTLTRTTENLSNYSVGLESWTDGRTLAVVENRAQSNGMSLHRFTEQNRQISGVFSIDCTRTNYNTAPKIIRLNNTQALVVWTSEVTDGDSNSIRGRYVSW
jgi:hypothetical protein